MFGYILIAIWLVGAYLIMSVKRPQTDFEVLVMFLWPLSYGVYYLAKLSNVIHNKFWAKEAFKKHKEIQ